MSRDQIIKSFYTITEMLSDRGILLDNPQIILGENIKKVVEVPIGDIKIVYHTPTKFKLSEINKDIFKNQEFRLFILVVQEMPTHANKKSLMELGVPIEIHLLKNLQFNITRHKYASKHRIIRDPQEIEQIVQKYQLKNKYQLPLIQKDDAMARWYGMVSGEIAEITRASESAGEYLYYRCCL